MESQLRLLASIREAFPDVPLVVAENKADLPGPSRGHPRVSAVRGDGVEEVLAEAVAAADRRRRTDPGRAPELRDATVT